MSEPSAASSPPSPRKVLLSKQSTRSLFRFKTDQYKRFQTLRSTILFAVGTPPHELVGTLVRRVIESVELNDPSTLRFHALVAEAAPHIDMEFMKGFEDFMLAFVLPLSRDDKGRLAAFALANLANALAQCELGNRLYVLELALLIFTAVKDWYHRAHKKVERKHTFVAFIQHNLGCTYLCRLFGDSVENARSAIECLESASAQLDSTRHRRLLGVNKFLQGIGLLRLSYNKDVEAASKARGLFAEAQEMLHSHDQTYLELCQLYITYCGQVVNYPGGVTYISSIASPEMLDLLENSSEETLLQWSRQVVHADQTAVEYCPYVLSEFIESLVDPTAISLSDGASTY